MFEDIQRIFRESVAAFRSERDRQEPEDEVASLLSSMRREWSAGKADLSSLAETLESTQREISKERALLEQCERRGKLAGGIGDAETVRVANEFAERHRERLQVLEQKLAVSESERALRAREVEEMKQKYQEADANRLALVAELRRAKNQTRQRTVAEEVQGSFADWQRMEERIEHSRAHGDALDELEADLSGGPSAAPPRPTAAELEERLRELKRRLGRDA